MTADKVGELEALLADLRTDDPRPRLAGTLEIRCANFMRNHGPELLRVYRAWQGAAVVEVGVVEFDVDAYCNEVWTEADTSALAGQRVRLVPDDGQGA